MNGLTETPINNGRRNYFFRIKTPSYLDGHFMIIGRGVTSGLCHTNTSLYLQVSTLLQKVQLDMTTALLFESRDP